MPVFQEEIFLPKTLKGKLFRNTQFSEQLNHKKKSFLMSGFGVEFLHGFAGM